ncbi:hypothetical protein H5410_035368, partial [Solanum commersonii]
MSSNMGIKGSSSRNGMLFIVRGDSSLPAISDHLYQKRCEIRKQGGNSYRLPRSLWSLMMRSFSSSDIIPRLMFGL